jgi:hypothetical protein
LHQRSHLLDPVEVFVPNVGVHLEAGQHTVAHVEVVGPCVEVGNLPVDGRMADDMLHVPAPEQPFGTSVAPQLGADTQAGPEEKASSISHLGGGRRAMEY